MTINQQITKAGGCAAFSRIWSIPYRTVQSWHREGHEDGRTPPEWLAGIILDAAKWRLVEEPKQGGER